MMDDPIAIALHARDLGRTPESLTRDERRQAHRPAAPAAHVARRHRHDRARALDDLRGRHRAHDAHDARTIATLAAAERAAAAHHRATDLAPAPSPVLADGLPAWAELLLSDREPRRPVRPPGLPPAAVLTIAPGAPSLAGVGRALN